jgi:hypothetical protein
VRRQRDRLHRRYGRDDLGRSDHSGRRGRPAARSVHAGDDSAPSCRKPGYVRPPRPCCDAFGGWAGRVCLSARGIGILR